MKIKFFIPAWGITFLGTSIFSFTEICCMFSVGRYYGFPYPFLTVHKTVETLAEAEMLKHGSFFYLIEQGALIHFSTHMTHNFLGSTVLSLCVDLLVSGIIAGGFLFIFQKFYNQILVKNE